MCVRKMTCLSESLIRSVFSTILLDCRVMAMVMLFSLSGILVDVCEENHLPRNSWKDVLYSPCGRSFCVVLVMFRTYNWNL